MFKRLFAQLKKKVETELFEPGFLALFTNPFYIARKELLRNISSLGGEINGLTLDIGCGKKPYRKFFASGIYLGMDIPSSIHNIKANADVLYDGYSMPVKTSHIDSVVTNQVFEHVFEPENFLAEINRILRMNGKLLITVPFIWDEHEKPYDYARYSSFGIIYLLNKHGFEIKVFKKTAGNLSSLFQLLNVYLYRTISGKNFFIRNLGIFLLMSPVTLIGLIIGKIFPNNEDLYLDNIILAEKIKSTYS